MKHPHAIKTPATVAIVVEKLRDARILRSLLSDKQSGASRLFAAQGEMSVVSLARNILVQEPLAVVLAYDSGGQDVKKLRGELSILLGRFATAESFRIVVFDPSLKEILGDVDFGPNDTISEETKRKLRRHPQVKAFLQSVEQLQLASEEAAEPREVQTDDGEDVRA